MNDADKSVMDRPDWRPRKPRGSRARACSSGELPENPEIRDRALGTALAILEDVDAHGTARIGAAKLLLDATKPDPREVLLEMLNGDRAAYARWLRAELAEIEKDGGK